MKLFETAFTESLKKEELKGGQKKLDVAPPKGKLTAADFSTLRASKKAKSSKKNPKGKKHELQKENFTEAPKPFAGPKTDADLPIGDPHIDDAAGDEEAFRKSLDPETDPKTFDGERNPAIRLDTEGVQKAREWIRKLEDMATFINGMDENSLNAQINSLEMRNSIPFKGIVRREEKRITKLAENLRGLAELFKTVVTSSGKKIHDATSKISRNGSGI